MQPLTSRPLSIIEGSRRRAFVCVITLISASFENTIQLPSGHLREMTLHRLFFSGIKCSRVAEAKAATRFVIWAGLLTFFCLRRRRGVYCTEWEFDERPGSRESSFH